MGWFQLDPESIATRTRNTGIFPSIPSLPSSLLRGIVGFTLVSIAGFAPWALFGRWFYRHIGEAGLYVVCAVVFIVLSGLILHKLIIGPGSLSRFYKLFGIGFTVYSVAWIFGWMLIGGHTGSLIGLLAGTTLMGWTLTRAFDARGMLLPVIAALFTLNTAGYFIGGWVEGGLIAMKGFSLFGWSPTRSIQTTIAMLLWGLFYGIGFGAGLGIAFNLCQTRARALLGTEPRQAVRKDDAGGSLDI